MIEAGKFLQQRYKIDKQIGQGGMGAVYVGTDVRFGSTVAIKETLCMDANFRKAIEREARLLNSLKHNALPRVSDHFEESDSQFLVMEYIAGDDVATILERDQRAFPVEQVLKWADDLLDALDYLHTQDMPVIHRDIKPQNLKITPRGQIILLDFGLAKGNPTDAGHQTAAKSIFGYSRNYASLEQIQGTGTDPRSDLYSLAATLYHLVTNTAPEDALTRAMSVLSQRPDPMLPASDVASNVPRGFAGVLHKSLDLNADGRPASAAVMRQMLRDSETYAYLAEPVTIAAATATGQQTRIAPEATQAAHPRHTEAKTEILPAYQSQVTSVAAASLAQPTSIASSQTLSAVAPKRRGFAVMAGALALLLVAGGIAGGLYVINPSVFSIGSDIPETGASLPAANADTSTANTVSIESETGAAAPSDDSAPATTTGPLRHESAGDRTEQAAKDRPAGSSGANAEAAASPEAKAESDTTRQTVIVTRDADPNGVFQPAPVPNVRSRPLPPGLPPGIDPKNLTPEQRRRLQRYYRMQQNVPPENSVRPAPKRTP